MTELSEHVSFPASNRLVAYLQTLAKHKPGLPLGQLVCVCASHTVTTTDALLHLATAIGPHIAILQVHADIIDDWSEETIRHLTLLAKKYAFLIWEGGRVLNATVDSVGHQHADAREVKRALVDFVRKKYTKGVVKTASWAGIATAWASPVAVNSQEADILIPTLKAAARESVADTVQTIRTEITADNSPREAPLDDEHLGDGDDDDDHHHHHHFAHHLTADLNDATNGDDAAYRLRKSSTISLTRTITQHTEDSLEHTGIPERMDSPEDYVLQPCISPIDNLPPPPLLARGLVLCLPSAGDSSFTAEYRRSCIAAARANPDFVVGFLSSDPWDVVSSRDDFLDAPMLSHGVDAGQASDGNFDADDPPSDVPQCLAVFSLVPHRLQRYSPSHARRLPNAEDEEDDGVDEESDEELVDPLTPSADCLNPEAVRLQTIVRRALEMRRAPSTCTSTSPRSARGQPPFKLLHIPVVSLP